MPTEKCPVGGCSSSSRRRRVLNGRSVLRSLRRCKQEAACVTPGDEAVVHLKKKNLVNEEDWERTMAIVDL